MTMAARVMAQAINGCWVGLMTGLILLLTAPAHADTVLEYQTRFRSFKGEKPGDPLDSKTIAWIAADRARLDRTESSVIFRGDERRMYFLDHQAKTWQQLSVPIKLEEHFVGEKKALFDEIIAEHASPVTVKEMSLPETIGPWVTRKLEINGETATLGSHEKVEVWNMADPKVDKSAYDELRRNNAALNPSARRWIDHALALPGITVKQKVSFEDQRWRTEITNELLSIEERKSPDGYYSPPKDYRQVGFDVSKYVQIMTTPRP